MGRKWDERDARREEHLVMRDDDRGIRREERKAHRMSDSAREAARLEAIEAEDTDALELDAQQEGAERFFTDEEALDFGGAAGEGRPSRTGRAGRESRRDARDRR